MEDITLKRMICYEREEEKNVKHYKQVHVASPFLVPYEEGMLSFHFLSYFDVEIEGHLYHVLVDKKEESYAFGESDTVSHLLQRMESGEVFASDYRDDAEYFLKSSGEDYTFFVTGQKHLMLDYFVHKIPVSSVSASTPDLEITENAFIQGKPVWYIEYQNYGDSAWHIEPTFCSDKEYRYRPDISCYRFVKCIEYEIQGHSYAAVLEREDEIHVSHENVKEETEVTYAIDASKRLIYDLQEEDAKMFEGYTRVYPFNTEDSAAVFRLHADKIVGQDCLTVTGSGDALFDLFLCGAKSVTCFDINLLAKYYAQLKFFFVQSGMSYQEYKEFFLGKDSVLLEESLYDKYSSFLPKDVKTYWDGIYAYLSVLGKPLLSSEHQLLYKIYDFFGSSNRSYGNSSSYFTEENYAQLQKILQTKSIQDVHFVDTSLFQIQDVIQCQQFGYAYLSNILDFSNLYFMSESSYDRLLEFKKFILVSFSSILKEDGYADIGFVASHWQTDLTTTDYFFAFPLDEGFVFEGLKPYNLNDYVLGYKQRKLVHDEPLHLK